MTDHKSGLSSDNKSKVTLFEKIIAEGIEARNENDDFTGAEKLFTQAVKIAEQLNDITRLAIASNELCACFEDPVGHEELFERAHQIAKSAHDEMGLIYCKAAYQLSRLRSEQGRARDAVELIDFILPGLERMETKAPTNEVLGLLLVALSIRGQFSRNEGNLELGEAYMFRCAEVAAKMKFDAADED